MQHYPFAVQAFADMIKECGMDDYEYELYEETTGRVIEHVKNHKSELGILYLNDFNEKVLGKIFLESHISFHPLASCNLHVYLWKGHPLADREKIGVEELMEYPFLSFAQGSQNSLYYAEEVLRTLPFSKRIKVSDRATLLNLMRGINGFTICSGISCEEWNEKNFTAVKLDTEETMTIGYLSGTDTKLSDLGERYLTKLKQVLADVL